MPSPEFYSALFTFHGTVMIFLFLIPGIPAILGNFVLPIMLGAKDVAFPRLNLWSYYLYVTGLLLALSYLGGDAAQIDLGLPNAVTGIFQGVLLFLLLACDILINFRVRLPARFEIHKRPPTSSNILVIGATNPGSSNRPYPRS